MGMDFDKFMDMIWGTPAENLPEVQEIIRQFKGDEKRNPKYHNRRTPLVGRTFASGGEAARAAELELQLKVGDIYCLEYQVRINVANEGEEPIWYVADFVYLDNMLRPVVEDYKGFRTPVFKLKKKLFKTKFKMSIREVH